MELEKTAFYDQLMDIAYYGNSDMGFTWTCVFVANNEEVSTLKVVTLDVKRDYVNNYADEVSLEVVMLAGEYLAKVFPNRGNLELVMYKDFLDGPYSSSASAGEGSLKTTYVAVLADTTDQKAAIFNGKPFDTEALNLLPPMTIRVDLVRKSVFMLRALSCGQTYRKVVPADVVKHLLTQASMVVATNSEEAILGVIMDEPDNTAESDHVIIDQPTALVDVAGYVQKNCDGIYSNGIGFYMRANWWYVFAPFDVTRYDKAQKTLTIFRVPPQRFQGLDRTWVAQGDNLMVLATGQLNKSDSTTVQKLNEGVGARYVNADKVMDGFAKTNGNKTVVSRADNVNEFVIEQRSDGIHRAPASRARITGNNCVEQSKLAVKNGSVLSVVWEHSNPDFLEPGMPVKLIMLDGDQSEEVVGTLVMSDSQNRMQGKGLTSELHYCVTVLHIFYKPNN